MARQASALKGIAAAALLAGAGLWTSACGPRRMPEVAPGRPGATQTGDASWYGPRFHGRATASGERYNMLDLTAAHRELPFGTYVRVTSVASGRSLVVRINDRGPFIGGRILDLSYTAAKILGLPGPGIVRVRLQVLDKDEGERLYRRHLDLVRRKGVASWSDRDFEDARGGGV